MLFSHLLTLGVGGMALLIELLMTVYVQLVENTDEEADGIVLSRFEFSHLEFMVLLRRRHRSLDEDASHDIENHDYYLNH